MWRMALVVLLVGTSGYAGFVSAQSGSTSLTTNSTVTGNASVLGALSKGSGTFVIDHPLDPKNKLLYHSFVESPDVKNLYDGIAQLDENGEAVVELPGYFLALNKDFRYLATPLSGPMPELHVAREIRRSVFSRRITFSLAGGVPGGTISWQVTGIRKDPLIRANPVVTEVEKSPEAFMDIGECVHPPLCNE